MLEPLTQLNGGNAHPKLAARIGIDSGTVVVGTGATAAADVFGDTPNIAARVQSAAEPDSVLVSSNTHDLISGLFLVEDRGAQALKGLTEPSQALSRYPAERRAGAVRSCCSITRPDTFRRP